MLKDANEYAEQLLNEYSNIRTKIFEILEKEFERSILEGKDDIQITIGYEQGLYSNIIAEKILNDLRNKRFDVARNALNSSSNQFKLEIIVSFRSALKEIIDNEEKDKG